LRPRDLATTRVGIGGASSTSSSSSLARRSSSLSGLRRKAPSSMRGARPARSRLEREAGRNVEVMWLTGRLVPDHKTIADFRTQKSR
jgi:hypothetical protein